MTAVYSVRKLGFVISVKENFHFLTRCKVAFMVVLSK